MILATQLLTVALVTLALGGSTTCAGEVVRAKTWPSDPEWLHFDSQTLRDLPTIDAPAPSELTVYGGFRGESFTPSGFFRTERRDGVWWLVDPEGAAFLSVGLNSVDPGPIDSLPAQRNRVERAFGKDAAWAGGAVFFLREHGFNTVGSFSAWGQLRAATAPLPYTVHLGFMRAYAEERGLYRSANGPAKYTDDLIPVFDPEFVRFCDEVARRDVAPIANDPFLIGFYSDNELPFPADALARCLRSAEGSPSRLAAEAWLAERGERRDPNTKATDQEFLAFFADRYFAVASSAIRRHDPNHLYLGSRLHTADKETRELFVATARYADVVSYNWYREWRPRSSVDLARWTAWTDKPLIVTEWYAKGHDVGLANTSGWGWTVPTQADRGKFYQHFALDLLGHPAVVGFHWHRYLDNDPDDPTADESSRDSNKGFVDLDYQPYRELCDAARAVNTRVYPLRQHRLVSHEQREE